jgi:translation elongation factor EF-4
MTAPTVVYRCTKTNGEVEEVSNPAVLPDVAVRQSISEPIVKMEIITPAEYNGPLMELCQQRRGAPSVET